MGSQKFYSVLQALTLAACSGCLPPLPENKSIDPPERSIVLEVPDGRMAAEPGVDDALWLEVNGTDGPVGGYFSQNDSPDKTLVILLHGASTFSLDGQVGSARIFHRTLGAKLQQAGFVTWSLAYQECGTPYGHGDLQDVVDAIDWLDQVGKATLGLEHVYVAGYSTGGTLSILINRQRRVSAVAAVSGLTESDSIETMWGVLNWVTGIYPLNLGACQMFETLNYYGPPGAPGWSALDTVSHIHELTSPMIVLHGTFDPLFSAENARDLEQSYKAELAAGAALPEMQFVYLDRVNHFVDLTSPEVVDAIVGFFNQHR